MTIMVHASDSEGVASFEFSVDGQPIQSFPAGGARLETRTFEWSPPGPAVYLIEVRALDTNGNAGSTATSLITVGGDEVDMSEEDQIETKTPTPTLETPTASPSSTPSSQTETPTSTPTSSKTPTYTMPPPEPAPEDTESPGIFGAVINPEEIYKAGPGCTDKPRTAESIVVAGDDGGISRIYGKWYVLDSNGSVLESGIVEYVLVNPEYYAYQGIYGPVNYDGTMEIKGTVMDNAGNTTNFFLTIIVRACIL
jgi:hypothetical protein